MKLIKIINSIYGHRPAGSKYIQPKRAGDPPFEVEDDKAKRLVTKGVAVYVDEPVATLFKGDDEAETGDNIPEYDSESDGEKKSNSEGVENSVVKEEMDTPDVEDEKIEDCYPEDSDRIAKPEYSKDTKFDDLRDLLKKCELQYKVGMTKADIVDALDEYFDGEEPPELDVEDPVL